MPIPKFINGYVRIPFPPAYSLAYIPITPQDANIGECRI